jgi:hypothetical protein
MTGSELHLGLVAPFDSLALNAEVTAAVWADHRNKAFVGLGHDRLEITLNPVFASGNVFVGNSDRSRATGICLIE